MTEGAPLKTDPNIAAPDEFYEALVRAHDGLGAADSERLNARLILLLANQIGDDAVLHAAIRAARDSL